MPKERIVDTRRSDPKSGIDGALTVRWTKDRKREPNCSPLADQPLVVTYDRLDAPGAGPDNIAAFIAFDRAGCNRLIRALRRARDDAFGRDE
jgi:hypothetical protein